VDAALIAADHAQANGGHDEAVRFLQIALDLLADGDDRGPRLLGRLGIMLAWALDYDEAVRVSTEAGRSIAETEGKQAAAEYLSDAAYVCAQAGGVVASWELARIGLTYAGAHDVAWARLVSIDHERQSAEDPDHPGIPLDTAERREAARILRLARLDPMAPSPMEAVFDHREDVFESDSLLVLTCWGGEFAHCLPRFKAEAEEAERVGRLVRAARALAGAGSCEVALGLVTQAKETLARADALSSRLATPLITVVFAQEFLASVLDEGWDRLLAVFGPLAASTHPTLAWARGNAAAVAARAAARLGKTEEAIGFLQIVVPWLERAPAWTANFPGTACHAAETLWVLRRLDHLPVTERAVAEKVLPPDFRYPAADGRLALARLCALTERYDEALSWFAEARRVLSEQIGHPSLAIVDYDEALMYARRARSDDPARARNLLEEARRQFEEIGMPGWIRRADELGGELGV
jgi:tetratricopeptide (TPR) repeat protein